VFSPGAGISQLVDEGFDALNDQILLALDTGFDKLDEVAKEGGQVVKDQVESALCNITESLYDNFDDAMLEYVPLDDEDDTSYLTQMDLLDEDDMITAINNVLQEYDSDDPKTFIDDLNDSTIKDSIITELQTIVATNAHDLYDGTTEYVDEIIATAQDAVVQQITTAYEDAVTQTINMGKDVIAENYLKLSEKIEKFVNKKLQSLIGSFIPSGLPIIPFFTWFCTLNVWYIEIQGEIPRFTVIDTTDETKVDTLFGHIAQIYHRRKFEIKIDVDGIIHHIGDNQAVDFDCITAA
jgi:hypothetical protein